MYVFTPNTELADVVLIKIKNIVIASDDHKFGSRLIHKLMEIWGLLANYFVSAVKCNQGWLGAN